MRAPPFLSPLTLQKIHITEHVNLSVFVVLFFWSVLTWGHQLASVVICHCNHSYLTEPSGLPVIHCQTYCQKPMCYIWFTLDLQRQISTIVLSCFYRLRCISKIRSFLSWPDLEKVIHYFISSRLDYCNSLYSGLSLKHLSSSACAKCSCQTFNQHQEIWTYMPCFGLSSHGSQSILELILRFHLKHFMAQYTPTYANYCSFMSQSAASDPQVELCWQYQNHNVPQKLTGLLRSGPQNSGIPCLMISDLQNQWCLLNLILKHIY